jgi:hypothetical protein
MANTPGPSASKKNMQPGSSVMKQLHAAALPAATDFHAIWLTNDNVVLPRYSAMLPGATNHRLTSSRVFKHVTAPKDPMIIREVIECVRGRTEPTGPQSLSSKQLHELKLR